MKVIVMVKATPSSEAGIMPTEALLSAMGRFNEELVKAGVMLAGDGLHPSSKGARVVFESGKTRVFDGPFTESKEMVAGYWIWEVKSRDEAIEWLKRAPFGKFGDQRVAVEIRQVFDAADFAPSDPTGELRRKEAELREKIGQRG